MTRVMILPNKKAAYWWWKFLFEGDLVFNCLACNWGSWIHFCDTSKQYWTSTHTSKYVLIHWTASIVIMIHELTDWNSGFSWIVPNVKLWSLVQHVATFAILTLLSAKVDEHAKLFSTQLSINLLSGATQLWFITGKVSWRSTCVLPVSLKSKPSINTAITYSEQKWKDNG